MEWIVPESARGQRLDVALTAGFPEHSRSRVQQWIRDGRVVQGGAAVRASQAAEPGAVLTIDLPQAEPSRLEPLPIAIDALYEDADLLVLDKPAGLQMHPGAGAPRDTLVQALLHRYPGWDAPGSPSRPGLVHRLDRDTSGLLLVARSARAYVDLVQQIQSREVTRRYIALAWGNVPSAPGEIVAPIARDPRNRLRMAVQSKGRPAETRYRVLHRFDWMSIVELSLRTGRTHQIRVHLEHIGHPIVGDRTYGSTRGWLERIAPERRRVLSESLRRLNRQALHAYHLACRHPSSGGRLRFESPLPADLDQVLLQLRAEEASG